MEFPDDFDSLDFPSFPAVPDSLASMEFLSDFDSLDFLSYPTVPSSSASMEFSYDFDSLDFDADLSTPTHNVNPTINQNPPLNCLGGAEQIPGHVDGANVDEQVALTIPRGPVSHSSQLDNIDSGSSTHAQNDNNGSLLIHNVSPTINQNSPLNCLGGAEQTPGRDDAIVNRDEQMALIIPRVPLSPPPRLLHQVLSEGQFVRVELSNPPAEQPPFTSSARSDKPTTYVVDPRAPADDDARMVPITQTLKMVRMSPRRRPTKNGNRRKPRSTSRRPEWRAVFNLAGPNPKAFTTSRSSGLSIRSAEWRAVFHLEGPNAKTFITSRSSGLSIRDKARSS